MKGERRKRLGAGRTHAGEVGHRQQLADVEEQLRRKPGQVGIFIHLRLRRPRFIFLFLLHFPLFFSRVRSCSEHRMKRRENVLLLPLAAAATSRPWLLGVYVHSRDAVADDGLEVAVLLTMMMMTMSRVSDLERF